MKNIIILIILASAGLFAIGIGDGVRLSKTKNGVDARSSAMGISFQGLVDNSSALYYNPAGLTLIPSSEIGFGMNVLVGHNNGVYLNNSLSSDYSNSTIQNATIAVPIDGMSNNLTFAFGYFNDNDYDLTSNLSGVNNFNTYISYLDNGSNPDPIPTELFLSPENGRTLIQDSVEQTLKILEDGKINRYTAGLALDINDKISLGFSAAARIGSFSQNFFFRELDIYNKYNTFSEDESTSDFNDFRVERRINQSFQSITGSVGILAKPTKNSRLSFALELPQFISVEDKFRFDAFSSFDNGDNFSYLSPENENEYDIIEYDIILPMKYRLGYSINLLGITASIGAEYTDLNNMEFRSTLPSIEDLNIVIPDQLGAEFSWGIGAEYQVPIYPAFVRASYGETTNPWVDGRLDLGSTQRVGVGGGLLLGDNFMLDVAYSVQIFDEGRFLYNEVDQPFMIEHTISNFVIGITYRY